MLIQSRKERADRFLLAIAKANGFLSELETQLRECHAETSTVLAPILEKVGKVRTALFALRLKALETVAEPMSNQLDAINTQLHAAFAEQIRGDDVPS